MAFIEQNIKPEYRSSRDSVVREFYIPLLNDAVLYKRAVGFFSSTALIEISKGISGLIKNGGKILLVASPKLSEDDINAINKGIEMRDELIERALLNSFTPPKDIFEEKRLNLLASLIAEGKLEIKIAFMQNSNNIGMFHEKMGLMYDRDENIIAFTGSMNETMTAFSHNYESIDVFCSWTQDCERVLTKERNFKSIWENDEPNVEVIDFPKVAREKFESYRTNKVIGNLDELEFLEKKDNVPNEIIKQGPIIPPDVVLHDYQDQAINNWEANNYVGIFDMATGTGKTYTGLGAIAKLYEKLQRKLAVIIVCPYQHLVEQWVEDIKKFGMKPIIGYSTSTQRDWKNRLKNAVTSFNLDVKQHFCFISTNATFSSSFVQNQVDKLNENIVLVVDEAHNFGAKHLSKMLSPKIPYRLALSATLDRHGDEEGTEKLYNYFGEKCIEYSLKQAIDNNKLTPYYYYPLIVCLNEDELTEYKELTTQVIKHCSKDKRGKLKVSETGKMLLIKRARLVAAAQEKITTLAEIIHDFKEDSHMLVYCGAATMQDPDYEEGNVQADEKRQIDVVANLLGNKYNMKVSKFTSEESAEEREELKVAFAEGKHLQTLIAIRCLDEGVNIPSIKTAFIMASSTNPKEYVQRRGRVLRKYPGKNFAKIYDFITLPISISEAENMSEEELKSLRSLASKEILRMKDFASIAENPSAADQLINDITYAFRIDKIGGEEDELI
ncbi:DEAD/DEAH box helicase family protein [Sutcliffiella cohnii]|uniref:DEAD/DEAH box helicase family protein n=1 Tax=Sutcliffiella cohnii TaxID=33932 RepID=UPI002E1F106B|nr:DEAD/DEAH box helicase family protein [Sutcliffiella cohnii]MED4018541.1 DEAD/DEAH box helicase family protein [Sutcliffiella cohnii]